MYRRAFAKKNDEKILEFVERLRNNPRKQEAMAALQELSDLRPCRAHVAQSRRLIWALTATKSAQPKRSGGRIKTLSMSHKQWVSSHREAHLKGIETKPVVAKGSLPAVV